LHRVSNVDIHDYAENSIKYCGEALQTPGCLKTAFSYNIEYRSVQTFIASSGLRISDIRIKNLSEVSFSRNTMHKAIHEVS
jgi:hypothetical protein